ncbi:MAG: zinc dependent phospholipase C family protein [Deferribacterales bacterium]
MKFLAVILTIIILPGSAFAWGFETHISIGMHILEHTSVDVIRLNPSFFMCGNIFPDLFNLFKDFSAFKRSLPTHSWATVSKMTQAAETDEERAFVYGYSAHLSADIIAHNHMVPQHIAYVNSGRMRSHLLLEMAEESMHLNRYSAELQRLLKFSPHYGSLFLRTMGISDPWFKREVAAIRLGVLSQKHLKVHKVTRYLKKITQPDFEQKCGFFREAALQQAFEAIENGYEGLRDSDPSGKKSMSDAKEIRKELLKDTSKRALKKEFRRNTDQRHFPLNDSDT